MEDLQLKQLISRYRGIKEADRYFQYKLDTIQPLIESARTILNSSPIGFGECALLSASWAAYLQDNFSIPAVVVAGDLNINGVMVFKTNKNLPALKKTGKLIKGTWGGHCWIEIDGYIGDLSVFRTAYSIDGASVLKEFILSTFCPSRGAMLCPKGELPSGMKYVPKYVLKNSQINGLVGGMAYKLENNI